MRLGDIDGDAVPFAEAYKPPVPKDAEAEENVGFVEIPVNRGDAGAARSNSLGRSAAPVWRAVR